MLNPVENSAARADEWLAATRYFRSRLSQVPPLVTISTSIWSLGVTFDTKVDTCKVLGHTNGYNWCYMAVSVNLNEKPKWGVPQNAKYVT
jgi:hypothetical protein